MTESITPIPDATPDPGQLPSQEVGRLPARAADWAARQIAGLQSEVADLRQALQDIVAGASRQHRELHERTLLLERAAAADPAVQHNIDVAREARQRELVPVTQRPKPEKKRIISNASDARAYLTDAEKWLAAMRPDDPRRPAVENSVARVKVILRDFETQEARGKEPAPRPSAKSAAAGRQATLSGTERSEGSCRTLKASSEGEKTPKADAKPESKEPAPAKAGAPRAEPRHRWV